MSSKLKWSAKLAYAVGLLVTDGSLSKDGRHIDFTSKDLEQIENFLLCLGIKTKISWKTSGYTNKLYPYVQFSNVELYKWLKDIGLYPNKTKTIDSINIPDKYFFDFVRGHHDGDGSFYSYWDKRWKSSYMYYLQFVSASKSHLVWIRYTIDRLSGASGNIKNKKDCYQLTYAKKASELIIEKMYKNKKAVFLTRKKTKIFKALSRGAGTGRQA